MIAINKEEAKAIRERFPDIQITRTMKQKSKRGHYFCVELPKVLKFLKRLRGGSSSVKDRKSGGGNRYTKAN